MTHYTLFFAEVGMASCSTRASTKVFLIKRSLKQSLTGGKLPSVGDVLRRFYYMHNEVGVELRAAASAISIEVMEFWGKARIR